MEIFQVTLLVILILLALSICFIRDTLTSIIVFMSYSSIMAIIWVLLQSPDLAITEAAVGAGVTSVLFFSTLKRINLIDASLNTFDWRTNKTFRQRVKIMLKYGRRRLKREMTPYTISYIIVCSVAAFMLAGLLLYSISFLPSFGAENENPSLNEIVAKYIADGIQDTGATNFVTGMILDYRAFDTLGESFVLFTAVNCVMILLQGFKDTTDKKESFKVFSDPIISHACSILVPIILMFGAYVILNGSISPGGGFSGGAIMGAGLILYSLAFGFKDSKRFFKQKTFKAISSISLLAYAFCKTYSFYTGANGIHSVIPNGVPGAILSGGIIFILNVSVGLVVTCTMFGFYSLFKKGEI